MTAEAVSQLGRELGVDLALDGANLLLEGASIPLPEEWEALDLRHALPSRAHGDQREKLLYVAVQDATEAPPPERTDHEFRDRLEELIPLPDARARSVLADAMREEYWVTPQDRPFLLPYHSTLPLSFVHARLDRRSGTFVPSRYRLFRGVILAFLCWTGSAVDEELVAALLDVFNREEGFTLLDDLMLAAAQEAAGEPRLASARALVERDWDKLKALQGGAFCQPSLDRFQRDLRVVLSLPLPRRDRLDALTGLLSLHLAIYYYRIALVLGEEVDRIIAATLGVADPVPGCDCSGGLAGCPLAGTIRFRAGTKGYRPASFRDGCAEAYQALDSRRLLGLPANVITANLGQHIWAALGGPPGSRARPRELAAALRADRGLARRFDTACAAFALLYTANARRPRPQRDALVEAGLRRPGPHALREAVLAARRNRLKHTSRDVVNQLAKRGAGSLIRSNGTRITFFELDEDFLFLLVKLVCGDEQLPFDDFLAALRDYGLAPQDQAEEGRLADALEGLGMLTRYSDAGESTYVRHPLRTRR